MRSTLKMQGLLMLAVLGVGLAVAGCKSTPPLSKEQALALIQAKYDATPPAPFSIAVNDMGMRQGVTAKYWIGTKRYPNGYWGDFQLTPEGKKIITLTGGGDVIQWRPMNPKDSRYMVAMSTVTPVRLRAENISDLQDQSGGAKMADYTEDVILAGFPDALQGIAHNPGNELTTKRTALFAYSNGAWSVQSIY